MLNETVCKLYCRTEILFSRFVFVLFCVQNRCCKDSEYQWTIGIALYPARSQTKIISVPLMRCLLTISKIQQVVYYQCCVMIG